MQIEFTHKLSFEDYKKWVIEVYYLKNKKRMFGYIGMMIAGVLLILFKLTNAFGLSDRYPEETLFLLGGSFIITPILFYIGTIRNSKKFFQSNPVFAKDVKYIFDEEKISFETFDENTGTCKWQNVNSIETDADFIKIILNNETAFLLAKNKIPADKLNNFEALLRKVSGSKTAFDALN